MSHYFDEFSKAVGEQSIPRRETLRRLGVAVTAGVLGPLGANFALSGHHPKPPPDPCKEFCKCRHGKEQDQCQKACKACNKNPSRLAGTCGNYYCCGTGLVSCGTYCADTANDAYNCGACGSVCDPPGQNEYVGCVTGACVYACYDGAVYCGEECVYLNDDPQHCGACGNVCPGSAPYCYDGSCHECTPGLSLCSETCVDTAWDPNNCGACGNVCGGSTPYCSYGACAECSFGAVMCNGVCTDIAWDPSNCGACGNVCGPYEYCYYGTCYYPYYGGGGYGGYWWY